MEDLIGKDIGHYHILTQLGQGGMSTIFKAYQTSLDREVAIKVLPPYFSHDPQFAERFRREATAIAHLRHPNILTVFDFGEQDGYTYIVMEYIEGGRTLGHLLEERGTLDLQTTLQVIQQVASALDYAHQRGVIHRDIKPSNILVPRNDWFLMSDFGIAKVADRGDLTKTGVGMGTPDYMSPEQGRGLPVDGRTDIYSLGVMLYRTVVGTLPYQADTPMGVIIKHINEPLPPPRQQNPRVPESVERVIVKAMAKDSTERFQTAGEMVRVLKMAVDEAQHGTSATVLGIPTPPSGVPTVGKGRVPPARRAGRPRWLWLAGGGILVLGVVLCLALILAGGLAALAGTGATPSPTQVVQRPTETPLPRPTNTPRPSTIAPIVTATPVPIVTVTPVPIVTATPVPTDTPKPTEPPTATSKPQATATPRATNTPKPTNTPPVPVLTGKIAFSVLNADGYHYDTWIVNADGTGARLVAPKMRQPCWRPDGVLLAVNGEAQNEEHIILMNADGSNHKPASQHVEDSHPSWSPDGSRLAFDSTLEPGGGWHIYIIDNPVKREYHVIPQGIKGLRGQYPTWMPDGRIIFRTSDYWASDTHAGLYAVWGSGDQPAWVTSSGADTAPAVSGSTVAFMSMREAGDYEIYTASVAGGVDAGLRRLTDNTAQDGLPAWSPDGKFIAFVSDEGGGWGLWVMNADGSGRRKLLNLPGTLGGDWGDERVSWSP